MAFESLRINSDNMLFQQDCATCHSFVEIIELMKEKFPEELISLDIRDARILTISIRFLASKIIFYQIT